MIYDRVRAIQGAAKNTSRKDVNNAMIVRSFAKHFRDSVDYHNDTLVDGKPQELIVARNKNVPKEKKIYAAPGEEFSLGALVDCFDCKWLVTEVDPNHEQYFSGKMEQCNREIQWQDDETLEIVSQWITMDKPYFSNLDENAHSTISTRMFKVYLPYDKYSSKLYVDKRIMLEVIDGNPITYRITSVDISTQRFVYKDGIEGFICLYIEQDQYNPKTDRKDLMICNYIDPDSRGNFDKKAEIIPKILFTGEVPEVKIGGSEKKFSAKFIDESGIDIFAEPKWSIDYLDEFKPYVQSRISDGVLCLRVVKNELMEGAVIKVILSDKDDINSVSIECKVVALL